MTRCCALAASGLLLGILAAQAPKNLKFPPDTAASEYHNLTVCLTCTLDLDKPVVSPAQQAKTADLWLRAKTPTDLYLVPVNGATMARAAANGLAAGCKDKNYSARDVRIVDIRPTDSFCVSTNGGNLAYLKSIVVAHRQSDGLIVTFRVIGR